MDNDKKKLEKLYDAVDIYHKEFYVAEVIDRTTVVVNGGKNFGIRIGMHCIIYGEGQEIIDPKTNESLGVLELLRGKAIVTQVQEKLCVVKSYKQKVVSALNVLTAQFGERYEGDNLKYADFDDNVYVSDVVRFLK